MATSGLSSRLQALANTYKQTLQLIQQLQKLAPDPAHPDQRIELASEIHDSLKEQEDSLEILRQEADDSPSTLLPSQKQWAGGGSVRRRNSEVVQDRESNAHAIARLDEDLKSARAAFRQAQLQAKRNSDIAKRKEREQLFANRSAESEPFAPTRRKGLEKLTQDEIAKNASNDITAALRRTHKILQNNLEQSQFAQQTLDESSAALGSLSESYSGVGDLLKGSRGLVSQLLRSQKSDTWYLQTAFVILCCTIGWLIFRRWLYGPGWWLVYQPLRWTWWMITTTLTSIGILGGAAHKSGAAVSSSITRSGYNANGVPTNPPGMVQRSMMVGAKGAGWDRLKEPPQNSMVEDIGSEAEKSRTEARMGATNINNLSPEERRRQEEQPRNPKKRMMEVLPEDGRPQDEL